MNRQPVITPISKEQLLKLAQELHSVCKEAAKHRQGIGMLLQKKGMRSGYEPVDDFFDKWGNNCSPFVMSASLLQEALIQGPDTFDAEYIQKKLEFISQWKDTISDKPLNPQETRSDATTRATLNLRTFAQGHQSNFDAGEWETLQTHIDGFSGAMKKVFASCDDIKRLYAVISPDGMKRGQ